MSNPQAASVESVMALARECAHKMANAANWHALRAEVTRLAAQAARTDGAISRDSFSGEQLRAAYEVSTARGYSPEGSEAGNPSTPAAGNFAEWARVWHDTASTIATIAGGNPNLDPRGMIESVQVAQSAPLAQQREYPPLPVKECAAIWPAIIDWYVESPGADTYEKSHAVDQAITAAMRAYVDADRASSGATTQAVRMLTAAEFQSVLGKRTPLWTPLVIAAESIREFCRVNPGRTIPPSGEIGGV